MANYKVILGPEDAAYVVREDGKEEVHLPLEIKDPHAYNSGRIMTLIACALSDSEMVKKMETLVVEMLGEESEDK